MKPIVKKAVAALAIKEGIERIAEARRPKKPSLAARLAKFGLLAGGAAGLFYAYRTGFFRSLTDRRSPHAYDSYEGSMTVQRPQAGQESEQSSEPVGAPTV